MNRFPVAQIRSVEMGTPDIVKSEEFYLTAWGLNVAARRDNVVYLRGTGQDHHVLALHPHPSAEILSVTFRAGSEKDLRRIAALVVSHDGALLEDLQRNDGPEGGLAIMVSTPEGYILRFVFGDETNPHDAARKDHPLRLAHVNLNCADIEATQRFFQNALGFCLTDRSKMMSFLRCNDDHHSVVLADSGMNGMNHIAFLVPDLESVMRASGRMIDHGYPIGWGVGRHGPGDNVFAYFVDPMGFVIEHTAEVLQVDDTYVLREPDQWTWPPGRTDHWGIAPPKPDSVKKAQLAIRFAKPEGVLS
jgi:catechol-2,3-dioxygenase